MKFDRDIYFAAVRQAPFGGSLTQQQVDGQNGILEAWEEQPKSADLRHLAYPLATAMHETASTMWPIEEYGKGAGMAYGEPEGPYDQIYYGRGLVQLTWWDNYLRADDEMGWTGENSCEQYPDNQLEIGFAAPTMFRGMTEGWFRKHEDGGAETLERYFNDTTDDAYGAREIINGDKHIVPSWSGGVNIGSLIAGYHEDFLIALEASLVEDEEEHVLPPDVFRKLLRRLIERRRRMNAFIAYIVPLGGGGGGEVSPPIHYPPSPGQGPGFPTPPIAPGGPPPGVWPSPPVGVWPNPPGGPPPGVWPNPPGMPPGVWPGGPGHPSHGLPGMPPHPGQGLPGGQPGVGAPVFPSNPIVIPGVPERPSEGAPGQPMVPPDYILVYYPGVGWVIVKNPNAEEGEPK